LNRAAAKPAGLTQLDFLLLAAVLALAAGVRVFESTRAPLWFDEIYTLWIARLGPAGILHAVARDVHPPLHELLVWLWLRIGGSGEIWLRSSSVVFGVATIAVVFALARDLFGRGAGLLAALLLALHRTHVWYSQELRSYSLLWMLDTLIVWGAWRFVSGRRGAAWLYGISAAVALYTHYQSGLVIACVAGWGAFALAREPRRLLGWLSVHVAIALAFMPQLPTFMQQLHRNQDQHWVQPPHAADLVELLRQYAFGLPLLVIPAVVLAMLTLLRARHRRGAILLLAAALPVIALSYVATQHGAHLFTQKYMEFALPLWCALLAGGVVAIGVNVLQIGASVVLALIAARSLRAHAPLEEAVELRLAARDLSMVVTPKDLVIHADTHSLLFFLEHEPHMGRQRLLLIDPALPYYEGADVIPDSLRISAAEFERLRGADARWWGVHTHHAGFDSQPALDTLLSHAGTIRHEGALVTVISGDAPTSSAPPAVPPSRH
jgi:mannosyltransferase